jgi:hypothetical protein
MIDFCQTAGLQDRIDSGWGREGAVRGVLFQSRFYLFRLAMKQVIPETPPEYDRARIVERPDGFYWQSKDGGKESGPFPTLLEAVEDMQYSADSDYEPGESVEQAEAEIGIADWVDPETGELAEEQTPRIEDH